MAAAIGNNYAGKSKRWLNAIDKALERRCKSNGQKALIEIAEKMLTAADNGESWAIKELGDRIDGKSAQSVTLLGDEEHPVVVKEVSFVSPK